MKSCEGQFLSASAATDPIMPPFDSSCFVSSQCPAAGARVVMRKKDIHPNYYDDSKVAPTIQAVISTFVGCRENELRSVSFLTWLVGFHVPPLWNLSAFLSVVLECMATRTMPLRSFEIHRCVVLF